MRIWFWEGDDRLKKSIESDAYAFQHGHTMEAATLQGGSPQVHVGL